jgi:DUF971 family protein
VDATPTAIRVDVARNRLEIDWADGHKSACDGATLRLICPCAGCRGHAPGEVEGPTWEAVKSVRIRNAQAVGGYAIRFDFTDAHDTGIYSYDWLRERCPAADVRPA